MAGVVTAIRVQKKNPRRASLYLDGQFAFGLSIEVVQDWGLRRGQHLSNADLEGLRQAERQRRAYQDALRLLSYRPRSIAETRQRLLRKGYEEGQVEAAIARLVELGLLDDHAFARAWVENRQVFRPRGQYALASELRQKGISSQVIAEVLDEMLQGADEAAQALALARERAGSLSGLEQPVFARRLQGFLARRGYSAEVVRQVVRQVWEETEGSSGR